MARPPRPRSPRRPRIFIGSSREGEKVAAEIKKGLARYAECVLWSDPGLFKVSEITIDNLEKALDDYAYAIIVMSPDDKLRMREQEHAVPRDNLIFELGLFVGRHGRRSAFMVAPDDTEMRLPSDLLGITRCHYRVTTKGKARVYDVSAACNDIARALREAGERAPHRPVPSKFWDGLSNRIRLVFGVEDAGAQGLWGQPDEKDHHKVSMRDLNTATLVSNFLSRRYPQKLLLLTPATTLGWQSQIQPDEDLILIGGFVTNAAYRVLREKSEQGYRVKMGRLCGIDGRRVFHLGFHDSADVSPPARDDAVALEQFPSRYVSLDFGLVTSRAFEVYGHRRRIITIAGIKGNGTQGAAMALIKDPGDPSSADDALPRALRRDDACEILVESRADGHSAANPVDETRLVEVTLNGRRVYAPAGRAWEPCEFPQSCQDCRFGIHYPAPDAPATRSKTDFEALVLDLDDTLVDTFESLITPLERRAARRMVEAGMRDADPEALAGLLLQLRRSAPGELEERLVRQVPAVTPACLEARRAVFAEAYRCRSLAELVAGLAAEGDAPPPPFELTQGDRRLLEELGERYALHLVTIGPEKFQEAKIEHLYIRGLFHNVAVIDHRRAVSKEDVIASLARGAYRPDLVVVVGNRLDHEVRVGNRLRMNTVWMCKGEGSSLTPGPETGEPDEIIYSLAGLRPALDSLRALRPRRHGR